MLGIKYTTAYIKDAFDELMNRLDTAEESISGMKICQ